tara:strand:+ start:25 stop:693 length:669 start_codon:yes stop_codon:yes gene_type:complete
MHRLIDKKKKIYFYLFFLFFLSSIFNFEIKKSIDQFFIIKKIEYVNKDLNIKIDQYLYKNIFKLDKKEISSLLINNYPMLNSFKINRIYPNKLKINLVETNAIAKTYIDGELFYIGENKKIFVHNSKDLDIPIIKGFVELDKINKFLKIIYKSSLDYKNIEYLVYHKSNRWDIFFKDNIILMLPIDLNDDVIRNADLILKDDSFKKKIIDLRIKNKLIISNE